MTSHIPGKFVLKCTTKMSLSDRFTQYQKMRPQPTTVSDIRAKRTSVQQASAVNRRIVQHLANRPSVHAYLGKQNNVSVKQRLGPRNVKARLNLDAMRDGGSQRGVLERCSGPRGGFGRGDHFRRGISRQCCFMGSRGAGVARGGRFESPCGAFRGNIGLGRGGVARGARSAFDEDRRGRGANRLRDGARGSFQRGGRGWVRGLRRGRGDNLPITIEQLDNQLDEYMSYQRANQDQDMVTYMDQDDS